MRLTLAVAALLVIALAGVARVAPARSWVFRAPVGGAEEADVRLFGNDAYYHLRHARLTTATFPWLDRQDAWVNYPNGYRAPEIGLYAWSMAGAALALGRGHPSERLIRTVVAWTPVVLGIAAYAALMALAASLWGPASGVLAGALLLAHPGTFLSRSLLGSSDHHVAEVLLLLLTMLGLVRLFRPIDVGPAPAPDLEEGDRAGRAAVELGRWLPAFAAAAPLAVFHFTWSGAPAYLLFVALALFLVGGLALARGRSREIARATFRYGCGFTLLAAVIARTEPDLVQEAGVFPRVLQVGGAIALGLPLLLVGLERAIGRGLDRRVVAGATIAAGLTALGLALAFTEQGHWIAEILTARRTGSVAEHSLTTDSDTFLHQASLLGFVALAAPAVAIVVLLREASVAWVPPVVLAALAIGFWATTGDFGYVTGPCAALLATFVLVKGAAPLLRLLRPPALGVGIGTVGLLALLSAPVLGARGLERPWPDAASLDGLMLYNDGWDEALRWMERSTPDPTRPDGSFAYGVLASWDFGSFVTAIARRPVLWSQGPDVGTIGWSMAQSEEDAERTLAGIPGEFRYAIVDSRTVSDLFVSKAIDAGIPDSALRHPIAEVTVRGQRVPLATFGDPFERTMASRLYYDDGSETGHWREVFRSAQTSLTGYVARPGTAETQIARVARILESPEERSEGERYAANPTQVVDFREAGILYLSRVEPTVKVFERVAGALLTGRATPGAAVRAVLLLRAEPGRKLLDYRHTVRAGADGRFAIRVPYWVTDGAEPIEGAYAPAPYRVFELGPEPAPAPQGAHPGRAKLLGEGIRVTEDDVRGGREIPVR